MKDLISLAAAATILVPAVSGQCSSVEGIVPGSAAINVSCDVDGDRAVFADTVGPVRLYERVGTTWALEESFSPPGGAFLSWGERVFLRDETLVIYDRDANGLQVYEEQAGSWVNTASLTKPPTSVFGYVSDATEDLVVAASSELGVVFVWRRTGSGWIEEQQIAFSGSVNALAVDGDTIGLAGYSPMGTNLGVRVFDFDGTAWVEGQSLLPADFIPGDWFGFDMSISGDRMIVSEPEFVTYTYDTGNAYVFERAGGTWSETAKLTVVESFTIPSHVAIQGDIALIRSLEGVRPFVLEEGTWVPRAPIVPGPGGYYGLFATGAEVYGDTVVTAEAEGYGTTACRFTLRRLSGDYQSYGTGLAGSLGSAPVLGAGTGCPVIGQSFSMAVSNGPAGAPGLFVVGLDETDIPYAGGSLLVLPPYPVQFPHVLSGTGSVSVPFTAVPVFAGLTLYAQGGYLDLGAPESIALTNGLRLRMH